MKKIMIFAEGTIFYTRPLLFLFSKKGYQPIGNAVKIINALFDQGNEIYLCSYVHLNRYHFIKSVMDYHKLRYTQILCRDRGENYADLVERIRPDILIEDDCAGIGGEKEWCITNVAPEIKADIKSIIVKEFEGIDYVVSNLNL